jgi:limonene-1,2-epoxide hydrolase
MAEAHPTAHNGSTGGGEARSTGATSARSSAPIEVVERFFAALGDLDIERALDEVDDEIVYQNMPLPPARGRDAFERQMRGMARYGTGFEARIHNIAANGDVVLTERTDVLEMGAFRAEFWVCGSCEVRDGRIVLWRDYFDYPTVAGACIKGLGRALMATAREKLEARNGSSAANSTASASSTPVSGTRPATTDLSG